MYIPFRQIFMICRFHEEANPNGSLKCLHPAAINEANGEPPKCSSNCIARKTLETMAMSWDTNSLDRKEIEKIESF